MKQRLLTYGLSEERLVHILEVQTGLACNCVCPNCRQPLIAKNNSKNKKLAHFAHHSTVECEAAYETALHLLAKAVLMRSRKLRLPDFRKGDYLKKGMLVEFDEVTEDGHRVNVDGDVIIPDAIGKKGDRQVFIEFANTHFVDDEKTNVIRKSGIACIEVDLTGQTLDEDVLKTFLESASSSICWISNPQREKGYLRHLEEKRLKALKEKQEAREKEIRDAWLLEEFKKDRNVKVLKRTFYGLSRQCPKKLEILRFIGERGFNSHPVLKRIIDGEFWNGQIYRHEPCGRSIFLKGQRIWVYSSFQHTKEEADEIDKRAPYFFKGLQEIKEALSSREIGDCDNCRFLVDSLYVDGAHYKICQHPKVNRNSAN